MSGPAPLGPGRHEFDGGSFRLTIDVADPETQPLGVAGLGLAMMLTVEPTEGFETAALGPESGDPAAAIHVALRTEG